MTAPTIYDRTAALSVLFRSLQTSSTDEKEKVLKIFFDYHPSLKDEWLYILETLMGLHSISFHFTPVDEPTYYSGDLYISVSSVIDYLTHLQDLTPSAIESAEKFIGKQLGEFIEPIVNRTLQL